MKKSFLILLIGVLYTAVLTSCGGDNVGDNEEFAGLKLVEWEEGNRLQYFDLEHIEKSSDLILIGKFTGDAVQEEIYQYDEHFQKDIVIFTKSKSTLEILKVYSGDVNEGDSITVTQYYGVYDDSLATDSKLTPMLKDDTWLFFLTADNDGTYYCTGDNDGRYPLQNTSYRKIALTDYEDLGVYRKEDFREDIYAEILKSYEFEY
ncbi:MAG: hypothetical protein NC203_06295 [Firmicutes bacterium]|nr:hypothetical protein [[Eubacterium] siraeum]MCM1487956.1 hypothetical protein [Bacillota bacterium]